MNDLDYKIAVAEAKYKKACGLEAGKNPAYKEYFLEAAKKYQELATLVPDMKAEYENFANECLKRADSKIEIKANGVKKTVKNMDQEEKIEDDMSLYLTFYKADELSISFKDVIGLESAKKAITQYVINPIKYPEAYDYKFQSNKCILLHGPAGTGKTTFAKALAKEIGKPFALINVASLVDSLLGETAKHIDKVFKYLGGKASETNDIIVVFFDEFDEIARKRTADDKVAQAAVPALLRNLDGITSYKNLLILANTNLVDDLDASILSRFRQRILVDLPTKEDRIKLFKLKLNDIEKEYFEQIDFDLVADSSDGLSGRTINNICDDFKYELSSYKAGLVDSMDCNQKLCELISIQRT